MSTSRPIRRLRRSISACRYQRHLQYFGARLQSRRPGRHRDVAAVLPISGLSQFARLQPEQLDRRLQSARRHRGLQKRTLRIVLRGARHDRFAAELPCSPRTLRSRDCRGVSAVEFALLLPVMLTLYLGSVEASQGIATDRKVELTAHALADLSSQYTAINNADMSNILNAGSAIIAPYSAANLKEVVSEISINAQGSRHGGVERYAQRHGAHRRSDGHRAVLACGAEYLSGARARSSTAIIRPTAMF